MWKTVSKVANDAKAFASLPNNGVTLTTGYSASINTGIFSFNGSIGYSFDLKGNIAYQGTAAGGVSTGSPSFNLTRFSTITNAPDVNKLEGMGIR